MHVLAAADKFKGTATASQVCAAIGHACWDLGFDFSEVPLADGGEGTLEVLGGANRTSVVTGPLGQPVEASWRFHRGVAVIEMARASGLILAGGPQNNDPMNATTRGTGELIDAALNMGARRIIVCLGGSATTDGGLGALRAIGTPARLRSVEFLVACDVETLFVDAARVFSPQKGATGSQVELLTRRLERLAHDYRRDYGIDVTALVGAGAAGGLAGALGALGATLLPGFDIVAEETGFAEALAKADLVITGEGFLDETSFEGKVVGAVHEWSAHAHTPAAAIVGDVSADLDTQLTRGMNVVSLVQMFGIDRAMNEPLRCIEEAARQVLQPLL